MGISMRRLSDKTLAKYEQSEKDGTLTTRQYNALWGHRSITSFMDAYTKAHFGHKPKPKDGNRSTNDE